jgi:hypothetical protein
MCNGCVPWDVFLARGCIRKQRNAASAMPERHVVGLALRPSPAGDRLSNGGKFFPSVCADRLGLSRSNLWHKRERTQTRRSPVSVEPPGDFISPDLPMADSGPLGFIGEFDTTPLKTNTIAMTKRVIAVINTRRKPKDRPAIKGGPCKSRDTCGSFLRLVHLAFLY